MIETAEKPPLQAKRGRGRPRNQAIRCADCGTDCKNDRAFEQHVCVPVSIDYLVGANL